MAAPKYTIWELEPHTRAKHEILRRYLQAWAPILSQGGFPEILYIDGFAGPGRYSKGEDGSPIIALRSALDQPIEIAATIKFLFVELKTDRADVLQQIVDDFDLPMNFHVSVAKGETFEAACTKLLASYKDRAQALTPTFAFIDPFGWSGTPFKIVQEIMANQSCEVLVTFMYEEINRFIGHPDQEKNFDAFFGTTDWRAGIDLADPYARNRFLHDLYARQLNEVAGARYVRSFQMRNDRDVTDYYLFYGTNNLRGLAKMKEAMWRVDESGEFSFSDATDPNQMVLFTKEPQFDLLRQQITARFGGRQICVGEIEEFVLASTAFRETHYKRQILRPMELSDPPEIAVVAPPPKRKRGTYGDKSLRIQFLPANAELSEHL